ncbi:MAG: FAD-binding oxidoreductase [SAR324 cluster bacterium]|nr:FAD-binding oxidoreductase [SAR324 cluster bacterium]
MQLSGWGNYPKIKAKVHRFATAEDLQSLLECNGEYIVRGLGRSYGDSSLASHVISTDNFNRILSFDENKGVVCCQAGIQLKEILNVFIPRGWFLPVTPGTKFITIGGAIASDVHGKNHHVDGSFSRHLLEMTVMLGDGRVIKCSPGLEKDLFWATCGGMGLTGVILTATFRLIRIETAYIHQETLKARNLEHVMELFEASNEWTYSVAWIDCRSRGKNLGRSLLMRGEHVTSAGLNEVSSSRSSLKIPVNRCLSVPFDCPEFLMNQYTIKAFNMLYYQRIRNSIESSAVDYNQFFYPLDSVHHWNRIYGKRGFIQYQFVLPRSTSEAGMQRILQEIAKSGLGSFLAVLKLFGPQEESILSFPEPGYTLGLDFPFKPEVIQLFNKLDYLVLHYGGKLYLTKDACMSSYMFKNSYQDNQKFSSLKWRFDISGKFQSIQSKRLEI